MLGEAGEELMENFKALGSRGTSSSRLPHHIHMSAEPYGLPPGLSLLEVNVSGLIQLRPEVLMGKPRTPPGTKPFGGTSSPKRPGTPSTQRPGTPRGASPGRGLNLPSITTRKTTGAGGEAPALATALAVLHMWGLDDVADRQMMGMVASLGLLGKGSTERPKSPAGGPGQPQLQLASAIALVQVCNVLHCNSLHLLVIYGPLCILESRYTARDMCSSWGCQTWS